MKNILLTLVLFVSFVSKGQNDTNTILGVDLDKDFYTLTDSGAGGYIIAGEENFNKNIPGASFNISQEYLINNANKEFLKIDFNKIILVFPYSGSSEGLYKLKPTFLFATKTYDKKSEYETNNLNDFNKVAYLLMNQFGPPKSTMNMDWGANFTWRLPNMSLYLTTHNIEQNVQLIYERN